MSSLQKSFAKAKLEKLPFDPPLPPGTPADPADAETAEDEADDDELRPLPSRLGPGEGAEDDSSSASSASSTGSTDTIRPAPGKKLFARPRGSRIRAGAGGARGSFAPLGWTDSFAKEVHVHSAARGMQYHAYVTEPASASAPLFVFHHGAGSSGLSFAACAAEMRRAAPEIGLLSVDARGHGDTTSDEPAQSQAEPGAAPAKHSAPELSLATLAADLEAAIELVAAHEGWAELPNMLLVGHSLGGAVVTHVAKGARFGSKVLGYVVLDVVEGSAMDALQSMQTYLSTRPKSFASVESAIEWHTRTRTIRTLQSARMSVPALLRATAAGSPTVGPVAGPGFDAATKAPAAAGSDGGSELRWTWRTDLAATAPFWEGWFAGLSAKFLAARGGKLLLLAGTDRLDTQLTIGQMQGKYQLQVYPEAGHFIHEDLPARTAAALLDFWRRNDGRLVLPPKVAAAIAAKEQQQQQDKELAAG